MTSPGNKTTLLQILTTTQHTKTTPPIRSTTFARNSTESLTTTYSTPTTSPESSETSQNTLLTSAESLTSMKTTPISASQESKTSKSSNIPTTSSKRTISVNIQSSSTEGIPITTRSVGTSQESMASTSTVIYDESIKKTTYAQTKPQESLKTNYIPTTITHPRNFIKKQYNHPLIIRRNHTYKNFNNFPRKINNNTYPNNFLEMQNNK